MSDTLLIPIHMDALCLAEELHGVSKMADYSFLPYQIKKKGERGYTNSGGSPNLAEVIMRPLFSTESILSPGIHLHWSLPDALTNGTQREDGTHFLQVPNRWLVLRKGGNRGDKQWIVESDYSVSQTHEVQ